MFPLWIWFYKTFKWFPVTLIQDVFVTTFVPFSNFFSISYVIVCIVLDDLWITCVCNKWVKYIYIFFITLTIWESILTTGNIIFHFSSDFLLLNMAGFFWKGVLIYSIYWFVCTSGFIINSPETEERSGPGGAHSAPGTRQWREDNTTQTVGFWGH